MKIQFLISKGSWANSYKKKIYPLVKKYCKKFQIIDHHKKINKNNTICILFSYFKKIPNSYLKRSKYNLIPHESDLPKGRGMSPLTWQILLGKENIVLSLIEASKKIDDGKIYYKKSVFIKKNYLFNEFKNIQFKENLKLILKFIKYLKKNNKPPKSLNQKGKPTFYKKRTTKHSILNINKSIKTQFDLLRSVDIINYPCFFYYKKKKFYIKIYV